MKIYFKFLTHSRNFDNCCTSEDNGQVVKADNQREITSEKMVDIPIQQSYLWYGSSIGDKDPQASGTYIFRPDGAPQTAASRSVPLKIVRGPLVDLVHQQFNLWIYQVLLACSKRHNCGSSWRE